MLQLPCWCYLFFINANHQLTTEGRLKLGDENKNVGGQNCATHCPFHPFIENQVSLIFAESIA
jgi:hypothetical protein